LLFIALSPRSLQAAGIRSQMLFEFFEGPTELRHRLLQIVSEHRRAYQIGRGALVVRLRSLGMETTSQA
jgi:hypothetical protein